MCRQDESSDIVLRVYDANMGNKVGGYETPYDTLVVLTLLLGAGLGLGLS